MSFRQRISQIAELEFFEDIDLTSYTTFKLAARGDLVEVKSVAALSQLLSLLTEFKRKYLVVGWGANQILPAKCDEVVIHLNLPFDSTIFDSPKESYRLPASVGLNLLTAHAVKFGLRGWEVFTGIPASLGGAIFMNAGTNLGEIGPLISKVKVISKSGLVKDIELNPKSFTYRKNHFIESGDVIVEAVITHLGIDESIPEKIKSYLEYRKTTQPLATKNCGCVFKNPYKTIPAGKLIDLLQLKGVGVGNLRISPKHGNFMENTGKANWDQFEALVGMINFYCDHFYGIEFELEVKIPYH